METKAHRARRQDYYPGPDGKPLPYEEIPLTKNRLAIIEWLAEFHDANTTMLHDAVLATTPARIGINGKPIIVNHTRLQNTLTAMRKQAGWISCFPTQYDTINADYKELVYRLTARGRKLTEQLYPHISSSSYFHDWMGSHVAASLKLAAIDEPGLKYIDPLKILARVPTLAHPYKFPVKIKWKGQEEEFKLSPDWPVFGLEFGDQQNFFLLEIDCYTEDNDGNDDIINATILKKVLAYVELDKIDGQGDNAFWHRLKITNNYVLIVTTSETRKRAILETVKKVCGKSSLFLVKVMPHFRKIDYSPQPMLDFWNTAWSTCGYGEVFLNALPEG